MGDKIWTGNKKLDDLRSKAAASATGTVPVSIEDLNTILPVDKEYRMDIEPVRGMDTEKCFGTLYSTWSGAVCRQCHRCSDCRKAFLDS